MENEIQLLISINYYLSFINITLIIKYMTSIDIRDAEVQQQFTAMRKSSRDADKEQLAE